MRVLSLTILALLIAWNPSNAQIQASRRLQDDSASPSEAPTAPEGLDDFGIATAAPTPAEGGAVNGTTPGDEGDIGDLVDSPTPAPAGDMLGGDTPSPVDDGFIDFGTDAPTVADALGGEGGDLTPSPTPSIANELPTFDEPTFDEPTIAEPTFNVPTFDEPTFDDPTFAEPTFDEPVFLSFPTDAPAWPVAQPTEAPIVPYIVNDDGYDPLQDEDMEIEKEKWDNETLEEMEHDQNVLIALSVVGAIGLCLALLSAQQLIENPDGCCASICRMFVACICGITRCLCWPCRFICGCTGRDRRNHDLIMAGDNNYTHDLELS